MIGLNLTTRIFTLNVSGLNISTKRDYHIGYKHKFSQETQFNYKAIVKSKGMGKNMLTVIKRKLLWQPQY